MRTRSTRLIVLATLGAAVTLGVAPPAFTATTTANAGLFGAQDPTYDGVYRQSLAILGLVAHGQQPDAAAINWLLAQQCQDGAFTAYRADTSAPCAAKQEDENATALAIQALAALHKPTESALAALKKFQLTDGGFYDSTAFGPPASDANSTGLALSAFAAVGVNASDVSTGGKTGDDYLRSLQLPCASNGGGAFDFQAEKPLVANDYATVQALLGQLGKPLTIVAATSSASIPTCVDSTDASSSASAAISYVANRLTASNGAIPSALGSGTDWTTTANAVLDLLAAGQGDSAIALGTTALQTNAKSYGQSGAGALGTLLLVAHSAGIDPTNFGGLNLVAALIGSERAAPAAKPAPSATPTTTPGALPMTGATHLVTVGIAGGALLALGCAALLASKRESEHAGTVS